MTEQNNIMEQKVKEAPETDCKEESDLVSFKCDHYKRNCEFYTPCCNKSYRCRFCHDKNENHALKREDVDSVRCSRCKVIQPVQQRCQKCNLRFGKYFCHSCKLFDDEDKKQFHCDGCGICRVGGRENFFHCGTCNMCLPTNMEGNHKCIENVSHANCPVCMEDIHTSRVPSHIPPCNHLIHKNCFDQMLRKGLYACPLCGLSIIDMKEIWKSMDKEIEQCVMPDVYKDLYANVLCRDCQNRSLTLYHVVGLKCLDCGGYNTARDEGPLMRKVGEEKYEEADFDSLIDNNVDGHNVDGEEEEEEDSEALSWIDVDEEAANNLEDDGTSSSESSDEERTNEEETSEDEASQEK